MKTCTQISDSGFHGHGENKCSWEGWLSQCKREVKSSPLTRASPTEKAGPPPYKHSFSITTVESGILTNITIKIQIPSHFRFCRLLYITEVQITLPLPLYCEYD